jgi:hypothetical protein
MFIVRGIQIILEAPLGATCRPYGAGMQGDRRSYKHLVPTGQGSRADGC